jgi:hypothetical protein
MKPRLFSVACYVVLMLMRVCSGATPATNLPPNAAASSRLPCPTNRQPQPTEAPSRPKSAAPVTVKWWHISTRIRPVGLAKDGR